VTSGDLQESIRAGNCLTAAADDADDDDDDDDDDAQL